MIGGEKGQNYAACDTEEEGPERKGDSPGGYEADLPPVAFADLIFLSLPTFHSLFPA